MADVTISYKNNEIATMNATGVKTLLTGDTFCEDDIVVAYTKPATPAPTLQAKTNISPTTSSQTITADNGYDGLSSVQINAMPSGSAATPATTITANPSISVSSGGLITASNSKTQSVTPTVSAGYVSSGTAGTITVSGSNTKQLTTQAAQTKYPSTSDQTISSGRYLTGTQTFKGVLLTNLTAGNIKKDVVVKVGDSADDDRIASVTGTYEGSSATLGTKSITANGTYNAADDSLDGYSSVTVSVSGGGGPNLPDPSTVTNLTGTTWLMNDSIDLSSFPVESSGYAVLLMTNVMTTSYKSYSNSNSVISPRFVYKKLYKLSDSILAGDTAQFYTSSKAWGVYSTPVGVYVSHAGGWNYIGNGGMRLWSFFDSPTAAEIADHTNATLVAWMKANGTLINIGGSAYLDS